MELLLKQNSISSQNAEIGTSADLLSDMMQNSAMTTVIKTESDSRYVLNQRILRYAPEMCALITDKALHCDIADVQVTEQEGNTKPNNNCVTFVEYHITVTKCATIIW